MYPEWNRDALWSKQEARERRRRSMSLIGVIIALGIALGVANQACYELIQRADRPTTRFIQGLPLPEPAP